MKILVLILCLVAIPVLTNAQIIIVSSAGTGDFISIQEGINASNSGDTVLVMPGVYFETIDFYGKDITVASDYLLSGDTSIISQTIIDGNHQNSRLVRFTSGETHAARLIGFTITNGFDDTQAATPPIIGLGIYIQNSSPTIEHNKIKDNEFGDWYICGGGIAAKNSSSIIKFNDIIHNDNAFWGGGIYLDSCSNVVIENNYIAHHYLISGYGVAEGGGIFIFRSNNITINNNLIEENYLDYGDGAGITAWSSSNLILINNILCNNRSSNYSSELYLMGSQGRMIGNLMYNNKYFNKRVRIDLENSQLDVINSTIIGNNYYAIACSNSTLNVLNSILNNPSDTVNGNQIGITNSVLHIKNSNIESDTAGVVIIPPYQQSDTSTCIYTDVISSNPMFTSQINDSYSLLYNSPCIDKGSIDTNGLMLPSVDLAGEPRIENWRIDIGAYEYPFYLSLNKPDKNLIFKISPNPANGYFTISLNKNSNALIEYDIYNIQGQKLMESFTRNGLQINTDHLKPGVYIVEITLDHQKGLQRLVIL
jgi:hypothetical protein